MEGTYRFASSHIKALFNSADKFALMLQSEYSPLLCHFQHEIEHSHMAQDNVLFQVVSVQAEPGKDVISMMY